VLQKVAHLPEKAKMPSKKAGQKMEHFLKNGVKKLSTFPKGTPKSDVPV
jgi:delta-aminolevulinic acid dehydratase/porphobilinogen synthase